MKMNEFFLAQLEREAPGTRRALERVPEGRDDWKPHEKSMPLGYLATLVARMPSWFTMMIRQDDGRGRRGARGRRYRYSFRTQACGDFDFSK
jgi:hypothetical protein